MVGQQVAFHRVLRGWPNLTSNGQPHFKNHVLEDKMKCIQCSKHFQWLIDANFKHDIAMNSQTTGEWGRAAVKKAKEATNDLSIM